MDRTTDVGAHLNTGALEQSAGWLAAGAVALVVVLLLLLLLRPLPLQCCSEAAKQ